MSTDPSPLFSKATQLAKTGQKAEALILLRRLLIQDPTHVPTLLYLAWLTPDVHEGFAALEKVTTLSTEPSIKARAQQGLSELRAKVALPPISDQPVSVETAPLEFAEVKPPEPPAPDPLMQARAVILPFRKLNRPIGELYDDGKITPKDLHWAAGIDPRVSAELRVAAQTLLAAQPAPVETAATRTVAQPEWAEAVAASRQVIWPYRHLNRPMGELLDEGKITASDLAYATRHAGASVRVAAQVLSQSLPKDAASAMASVAPATEMTLAEAQAVIWPYRKLNRPMGELLAEGKITPQDLQYAIDHARPEVLEAAQLLLDQAATEEAIQAEATGKLEEPAPVAPPAIVPRADGTLVVVGSSAYLKRNQFIGRLKTLAGALFSDNLLEEGIDQYTSHKRGERGEEEVVRELANLLDRRWKLYRNLTLPDSDADLDAVLIGPTGVLLLEIKAFTGSFRVRGTEWSYRQGAQWRPMDKNPTKQVHWNRQRLSRYLWERLPDHDLPVRALIVLGREPQYLKIIRPTIYVAPLRKLTDGLKPYLAQPILPEKTVTAALRTLDQIL
jgi:hypothetical protein